MVLSFQWLGGFFSFLYPLITPQQRENVMPFHVYFGISGYVLAIAAALMGLNEKAIFKLYVSINSIAHLISCMFSLLCRKTEYSDLPNEAMLINTIGMLMILFGSIVLYLATNRHFRRLPLPEDVILLTGHNE